MNYIKLYETLRNKYITDKNGFYAYIGNIKGNYSSLYKNNKNPLFEKGNENPRKYLKMKIIKDISFQGQII